ncbi:unnamed protein product [marine sediment metagenome]|uniref:Uncharacterized protein n=1 Tax=marine sediment metagenome TaxID=412755 RepID=X1R896_9ZZZZ
MLKIKKKTIKKIFKNKRVLLSFGFIVGITVVLSIVVYFNNKNRNEIANLKDEISQLKEAIEGSKASTSSTTPALPETSKEEVSEEVGEPVAQAQDSRVTWESEEMQNKLNRFRTLAKALGNSEEEIQAFLNDVKQLYDAGVDVFNLNLGKSQPSTNYMPDYDSGGYDWKADELEWRMDDLERKQRQAEQDLERQKNQEGFDCIANGGVYSRSSGTCRYY